MDENALPMTAELSPWGAVPRSGLRLVPTGAVLFTALVADGSAFTVVPMPAGGTAGPGGRPRPGRPVRAALAHGAGWLLGR